MNQNLPSKPTSFVGRWKKKFAFAFRGIVVGARDQNSFYVHGPVAVAVPVLAYWINVSLLEWALLTLCITLVISAELFNSAIEHLAQAITRDDNPEIRDALDVASGAVLVVSAGAAVVGSLVLLIPLYNMLFGG